MPLESASYISDLEVSNPASTDQVRQADDHIRLIKAVLLATFPNITGPVTATQAQLSTSPFSLPAGLVLAWYGSSGSIPSGWALCNGQTVAKADGSGNITTPSLVDRTIVGAGAIAAQGATAGATTATTSASVAHTHGVSAGAHSHVVTVNGTSISIAQMPAHSHGNGVRDDNTDNIMAYGMKAVSAGGNVISSGSSQSQQGISETIGGGEAHGHTATTDTVTLTGTTASDGVHTHTHATIQPSLGLHWIMKT